jgi:Ca2+-binding RTX toxin-like protein
VASDATKAVTYTGSEKVDTITINNALNNVVSTAGGNDVIVTGSGADSINAGAGDDSITSGSGLDVIDVGTGTDTYVVTANANGNIYASITGMTKGDKIDFIDTQATFTTAKIALAGTAAFADYLAAATAGAAHRVVWFQFGGDTYLVHDRDGGAAFVNGTDQVVKLVGTIDLSTSTIDNAATNVLTLG